MKKFVSLLISATIVTASLYSTAYSADYNNTDIPIGQSGQAVQMIGTIKPTIMSVTMPSAVPFDISKSVDADNKVVSPRIKIKNNSNVPVSILIGNATVDISKLKNTSWSDDGKINDNQIAIGLKNEIVVNTRPTDISDTKWIKNGNNNINIMNIKGSGEGYTYVVGAIGKNVPEESTSTFSVVPIFMVTETKAQ